MNLKKIICYVLCVSSIMFIFSHLERKNNKDTLSYDEYLDVINEAYGNDEEKILSKLDEEINNKKNSKEFIGINLLTKQFYFYKLRKTDELIGNSGEVEKYLIKYNMNYEVLQLYSMLASKYSGSQQYENAYVYIYKGEKIATAMYEKDKDEETLSTLVAIKYMKAVIALEIGMENEATKVFAEAEKLRNNEFRERVDIYINILLYYEYNEEYKYVEEYANKVIDLINRTDKDHSLYQSSYITAKTILARAYLNTNGIDKCIDIINELKEYEKIKEINMETYDRYYLYAHVYKYYGYSKEYIEYLEKAYDKVASTNLRKHKFKVVQCIIDELELINDKDELIKWYKVENSIIDEFSDFTESQMLLSQIIDTDLQNAKYNIDILQLEKNNMIYLILLLTAVTGIILIVVFVEKRKKKLLRENMNILQRNMEIQYGYYENIREHEENIKRIKHDLKNHIEVMKQLIVDEDYESSKYYLENLEEEVDKNDAIVTRNNKIIDAIVLNKIKICKLKKIDLDLDINIPGKLPVDDYDISVIYGNLLDNAIEAYDNDDIEDRSIRVKSFIKGSYLFINIKNNFSKAIKVKNNKLITSKKDKINHGLGMDSIKKSIKKYDGNMNISYDNNEFNVSIILNIEQR